MDPITHGLLGATLGHAFFRKSIGPKAPVLGAAIAMSPDLDVIVEYLSTPWAGLYHHRGLTHGIAFAIGIGFLLACFLRAYGRPRSFSSPPSLATLWLFCCLSFLSHGLLDTATSYGTQLLSPFSNKRFSWNIVAVIDPFYSGILALGLWITSRYKGRLSPSSITRLSFIFSLVFMSFGFYLNHKTESALAKALPSSSVPPSSYILSSHPTLFQLIMRHVVYIAPDKTCTKTVNSWNLSSQDWECKSSETHPALSNLQSTPEGKLFSWFTQGMYRCYVMPLEQGQIKIKITDLRYKEIWGISAIYNSKGEKTTPTLFETTKMDLSLKTLKNMFPF